MQTVFANPELETLYLTGRSRKYRLQPQTVRRYVAKVNDLKDADTALDLWAKPGLNFERLSGTNLYSVRVDRQYRLEFTMDWTNPEQTVGIVGIEELSMHYGD